MKSNYDASSEKTLLFICAYGSRKFAEYEILEIFKLEQSETGVILIQLCSLPFKVAKSAMIERHLHKLHNRSCIIDLELLSI